MTIRIRPCHERTEIDVADDGMMILRRFAAETEGGEEKLRRKQAVQPLFISGVAEDLIEAADYDAAKTIVEQQIADNQLQAIEAAAGGWFVDYVESAE